MPDLYFYEPPPEKRIGGLDAAIQEMRRALEKLGWTVKTNAPPPLAESKPVVHFHGLRQFAHNRLSRLCATRGVPCVVSPHGMLEPWAWNHKGWKKRPYFAFVEKGHLSRVSALLATSEGEAAQLRRFFPGQRIEILPLGLTGDARPGYENARAALGWRADERVLLFLSRIHPKKGLEMLLEALATGRQPAETRLVVVGDGEADYLRRLRAHAAKDGLPRIDWIGPVWGEARWLYFQGADLFCLPTHSENFGLAVLEACQVGTPALTTTETPWANELAAGRGFIGKPTVADVRELLTEFFQQPPRDSGQRGALSDWAHAHYDWE